MRRLTPLAWLALVVGCSGSAGIDVPGPGDPPGGKDDDPSVAAEPCNGVDDDDDGLIDLDPAGNPLSRPCETECSTGNEYCEGGTWVCYAQTVREEVCDNFDNDCDGEVDEDCECRVGDTRDCGQDNVGACRAGAQTCQDDGHWGACTGIVEAGTEECGNGLDDDCNGEVDETCGCTPGTEQVCGDDAGECVAGRQTCDASGAWGDCAGATGPGDEVCNGLDDDCDGTADDPWQPDEYEPNDDCTRGYDLGEIEQEAAPILVGEASLFALQDEDWFQVRTIETDDWCIPGLSECSHRATFTVALDDGVDPDGVEVCAFHGTCADGTDATRMTCTHSSDWDGDQDAYVLAVVWGGTCGSDDARDWQVVVRASGEAVCGQYSLAVRYDLADLECPE